MERTRVLLADSDPDMADVISEGLMRRADIEVAGKVCDGAAVMDAIAEHIPDVLVTDLILPRCDGFVVLEKISQLPEESRPRVIVLTSLSRDELILRALRLGAAYYMVKPFDIQVLGDRIRETAEKRPAIAAEIHTEMENAASADEQITNLFLTLGIPASIKGYQYLREAVRMVINDHSLTGSITKELYPGVAKRFGTTASKVERAMRHAIEVAWNRGRLDIVNRMYGHRLFEKTDKPSNSEFISCVAEKISLTKTA
ncbi:MAG: sporulation transcription factor Spo0A [Clostridia bacterium]|nr:sporulation transcription factor Spo0A [Clostridia bacterium]